MTDRRSRKRASLKKNWRMNLSPPARNHCYWKVRILPMSSIESCPALVGKYHDQLRRASGQLLDFGWRSNIVVDRCRDLLAAFLVGTPAQGIQYIALGRGDSSWDLTPPSPPVAGTTTLVDATPVIAAVTDSTVSLDFVDAVGAVTATPSHRLQLTLTVTGADFPISGDE